jgi:hypothetical protein
MWLNFVVHMMSLVSQLMRHEHLQTAVILIAFLLFFLSWPISHLDSHYFSAADLSQNYSLFNLRANYVPGNPLLTDTFVNSQPWLMFNRDNLRAGQLPLWNPYNANGMPHLANYQSAVFSLFSLPYYFLDFKIALLVSEFCLLFAHGFFSYAYFRRIKIHHLPALTGAVGFMYAGYNVLWLGWLPVVASGVSLPIGLFFIEQVFQRFKPEGKNQSALTFWLLAGFSASLVIGLLAGHPETFYTALLFIAIYTAHRILCVFKDNHYSKQIFAQLGHLSGQIIIASLLAAGISAIQLIPFLEYMFNSAIITNRSNGNPGLDILPLLFFPNLLGSPSGNFRATLGLPFLNYNESNSFYIGSLIVFIALLSVTLSRRNRYVRFFAIAAAIWFIYFFNIFGVGGLIRHIPGISLVPPIRTHIIWLFSLSCCAAFFIDYLLNLHGLERLKRWWLPALMTGLAMIFIAFGILQAITLTQRFAKELLGYSWLAFVPAHGIGICLTFGIGVLALVVLYQTEHQRVRVSMCGIILLVVLWQGGYQFKTHNPITENDLFYPLTPAIQTIQNTAGNSNTVILGYDSLPADSNLVYKIPMLTSYDALWIAHHDRLFRDMFSTNIHPFSAPRLTVKASAHALELFGAEYLVVRQGDSANIDPGSLREETTAGPYTIYKYTKSPGKYFTVDNAIFTKTDEEAWTSVHAPSFDPKQTVIINGTITPPTKQSSPDTTNTNHSVVQVISQEATSVKLKVTQSASSYLVLTMTYYPGWKAKVNGTSQPVQRANYAFSAIMLNPGESEVEFYYDPDSVRYGLAITGFSLLCGIILIVRWLIIKHERNQDNI